MYMGYGGISESIIKTRKIARYTARFFFPVCLLTQLHIIIMLSSFEVFCISSYSLLDSESTPLCSSFIMRLFMDLGH